MDAHEREYAGAVAGMLEAAGREVSLPAQGDFVSGKTAGKHWSGHVEWVEDDGKFMCINVGGGWLTVPTADITH
jgi:hypothetical protein